MRRYSTPGTRGMAFLSLAILWSSRPILVSSSSSRPSSSAWSTQILPDALDGLVAVGERASLERRGTRLAPRARRRRPSRTPRGFPTTSVRFAVGHDGPVAHLGQDFLDHVADQVFGHLHGGTVNEAGQPLQLPARSVVLASARITINACLRGRKDNRPPMSTVSTSPITTASIGSFSVSGVSRALDPWQIKTISSSPAPRVSTATNVRPVGTSRSRDLSSTR